MKICIPSEGPDPSAEVDSMFGRARYFIIFDDQSGKHEYIDNSENMDRASGAGIQAARQVAEKDVDCVISGHVGPRALNVLQEAGIRVCSGASGLVWDAIEACQNDELHEMNQSDIG